MSALPVDLMILPWSLQEPGLHVMQKHTVKTPIYMNYSSKNMKIPLKTNALLSPVQLVVRPNLETILES